MSESVGQALAVHPKDRIVAWYQNLDNLMKTSSTNNEWWTHYYKPGGKVPVSGIYKCRHCKKEVTCNKPDPFPPQDHHQHPAGVGAIEWELIVRTNTDGS
jgi:hypothetical protein